MLGVRLTLDAHAAAAARARRASIAGAAALAGLMGLVACAGPPQESRQPTPGAAEIDALVETLKGPVPADRYRAARRLTEAGEAAVPTLQTLLADPDWVLRTQVVWIAADMGESGLPLLERALDDDRVTVRSQAAVALGKVGGLAAVDALVEALRDSDPGVRTQAARSLREMGPLASAAAGELVELLADADVRTGRTAMGALAEIGAGSVPALAAALDDSRPEARRRAAWILGRIGAPARRALPDLEARRQDPVRAVREAVEDAIGALEAARAEDPGS